jgi:CheY-like chemotaxis protein
MRRLREILCDSQVPVVLAPVVGRRQQAGALRLADYLVKPITRAELALLWGRLGVPVSHVLIVDDDPQMTYVLPRLLQSIEPHLDVTCVSNGIEGLEAMHRSRPDLVFLDLVMPELNGYEVLAMMRRDASLREVPVVVLTGQARLPEEERGIGGHSIHLYRGVGFTNNEVMGCLQSLLDGAGAELAAWRFDQSPEADEEVILANGLSEIGRSPQ